MKRGSENLLSPQQLSRFYEYSTEDPLGEYELIMAEFDNPEYKDCGYYTHSALFLRYDEYHIWNRKLWEESVDGVFENTIIPLPIGWDEIMREYYGEYMAFPPKEKRISNHSDMIIDMDRPYTEYLR